MAPRPSSWPPAALVHGKEAATQESSELVQKYNRVYSIWNMVYSIWYISYSTVHGRIHRK